MPQNLKFNFTYLILFFLLAKVSYAQKTDGGASLQSLRAINHIKTRLSFSPVLGFYSANKNHTSGSKQKLSYAISLKAEIRLTKEYRDFIMLGVEYMNHGVNFNSYFFYSDSIKLYTPNRLRYSYNLTIHELNFPVLFKHSFEKESNSIFSKYIFAGYSYRYIFHSNLKVDDSGNEIYNQTEKLIFKNATFNPKGSSFLCFGGGIQHNVPNKNKALFAEVQFKYSLSPIYLYNTHSPSSLYINGHFLCITIGFKF